MTDDYRQDEWTEAVGQLRTQGLGRDAFLQEVCGLLARRPGFDWVGFYLMEEDGRHLRLGPFVGEPTEHVRIPVGRGICGQAAASGQTFVVQDVSKETNYLSCSLKVKSEIVLPILSNGKVVAELDIDSHKLAAFGYQERLMLEAICRIVEEVF